MPAERIELRVEGSSTTIITAPGIFNSLKKEVARAGLTGRAFFIIDQNVFRLHKQYLAAGITAFPNNSGYYLFNATEKNKTLASAGKILSGMVEGGYGRDSVIIAIGGGITGDVAGLAAGLYARGIELVHVPTTVIAATDSALGGKTGVNLAGYKNMAGAFHHASLVLTDTHFFTTLPATEIFSAAGEIIKYGILAGDPFFSYLRRNLKAYLSRDEAVLRRIIKECVAFKCSVVSADERERSLRKILNLGHTFAHAYEKLTHGRIPHGTAVGYGIIRAIELSYKLGFCNSEQREAMLSLPRLLDYPDLPKYLSDAKLAAVMSTDKKSRNTKPRFVLPVEPGKILIDVQADL